MTAARNRLGTKVFAVVLLFCLAFAVYTQHAWEDYWITFRASRNLATGHGLVYTPGERLHTFTSPLGVLLPAGFSWLCGNRSDELVLWLFRIASAAAFAAGVVLLLRVLRQSCRHRISIFLAAALLALDAKTVDFSINGMETGLLIFFLALTVHGLLVTGPRRTIRIGVGWAGLMWTRPDSSVYIAILGLSALIFLPDRPADRKGWWKSLLQAGLICTVMYLPWFVWAWSYYGSPVPYPIVAKGTNLDPISVPGLLGSLLVFPAKLLIGETSMCWTFLPAYARFGGWHECLHAAGSALGLAAAFAWMIPVLRPQTRLFSWAFFLGTFFLTAVVRDCFPWYLPMVAVFGYLTIGLVFDQLLCLAPTLPQLDWARGWFRHLSLVLRVAAVGLVIGQAAVTVCVARQLRVQQEIIENGLRRQIGLWLHDQARSPQDTVMLEPLGYIGYFSGLKMLDYPGLSSKKMVEVRKRLGPDHENQIALELKPDWLVLRPFEIDKGAYIDMESLQKFYDPVRVFDAADKVSATRWLPGKSYLQCDQTFVIFHRKADASSKPPG